MTHLHRQVALLEQQRRDALQTVLTFALDVIKAGGEHSLEDFLATTDAAELEEILGAQYQFLPENWQEKLLELRQEQLHQVAQASIAAAGPVPTTAAVAGYLKTMSAEQKQELAALLGVEAPRADLPPPDLPPPSGS